MNFKKMSLAEQKKVYLKAKHAYYNEEQSFLSDPEFDKLEDLIKDQEPDWSELHRTGVRTTDHKGEVALNQFMPSLEKSYPDELPKFFKRLPATSLFEMDKLDGTSLQLRCSGGKPIQFATRGDGVRGRDISHFIPALIKHGCIPGRIAEKATLDFRLEAVMKKKTFAKKWSVEALGEKEGFENSRQLVNGVFLRKVPGAELADIDLVVLGVYDHTMEDGLLLAAEHDFDVVWHTPNAPARAEDVSKTLDERRTLSPYEIDGLVITHKNFVLHYTSADKPKQIFAYKENDEENAYEVHVDDIEYDKTRLGRISIVALITPTRMDGVVVERVTVHNAAWMMENNIGPGARIKVLRSGGVIPKIVGVVSHGKFKAPPWPYVMKGRYWHVAGAEGGDVDHSEDRDISVRAIRFFMTTLGIDMLAEKTIDKLYDEGFDSIGAYIKCVQDGEYMSETKTSSGLFMKTEGDRTLIETQRVFMKAGIGENQSLKLITELRRVLRGKILLKKLMVASGKFDAGIGIRKLSQIEEAGLSMRDLCNMRVEQIEERMSCVKGWSDKTIALLTDGVPRFREWYKPFRGMLDLDGNLPEKRHEGKLSGKRFAWTGYRDAKQENTILANGGIIVTFGGTTDVLFYSAEGKRSSKVDKAGDRAMLWNDFAKHYGIE